MTIILIGAGASGISFLTQLSRLAREREIRNITVKIIAPSEYFARGKAFGQASSTHIINTPSDTMGLDIINPLEYASWLKRNNLYRQYTQRLEYSNYIKFTYNNIKKNSSLNVIEIKSNAIDIALYDNKIKIVTSNNKIIDGDYLVYAPGHITSSNFSHLVQQDNFFSNPYFLKDIPKNQSVGILGSGLTAIDVVRHLVCNGHLGKITLYSRSGNAPTCLSVENKFIPQHLTYGNIINEFTNNNRLTIKNLLLLLKKEVKNVNIEVYKALKLKDRGLNHYWKYLYSRSSNSDLPFQDILTSTRNYAHKVWELLTTNEQLIFNNYYSSNWATWRHPVPRSVIQELINLHEQKQLNILKIDDKPIYQNNSFLLKTNTTLKKEKYLIDATGGSLDFQSINNRFLKSLIKKNFAIINPTGGIKVSPNNFQLINNKTNKIYAFGQITKGTLFSTNAFWFNAQVANSIANNILNKYENKE